MKYDCGTEVKVGDVVRVLRDVDGARQGDVARVTSTNIREDENFIRVNDRKYGAWPSYFRFLRREECPPTPWLDGDGVFHGTPLFRRKAVGYDQAIDYITLARNKADKVVDAYDGNRSPKRMACSALTVMENELLGYFKDLYDKADK